MPNSTIRTKRDERLWEKAKEIAADAGFDEKWDYIMGVYKKMNPKRFNKKAMHERVAYRFLQIKTANWQRKPGTDTWELTKPLGKYVYEPFYSPETAEAMPTGELWWQGRKKDPFAGAMGTPVEGEMTLAEAKKEAENHYSNLEEEVEEAEEEAQEIKSTKQQLLDKAAKYRREEREDMQYEYEMIIRNCKNLGVFKNTALRSQFNKNNRQTAGINGLALPIQQRNAVYAAGLELIAKFL